MDSLLSNAQRCARKADSLVNCGLYDESLMELEKSIEYLNELKSTTSCYESIQLLNAQLESIDRKMRSVAIKRSESIKKKNQIECLINKNRRELTSKSGQSASKQSTTTTAYCKLEKDGKIVIEELSTNNAEYKKVNSFLIEEIENLKRENEFLKSELLKMHSSLNMSQNSSRSSLSISESSSSLMLTNQDSSVSNAHVAANASTSSTCDLSSSSMSTAGVVPQQQQQQQQPQQQQQQEAVAHKCPIPMVATPLSHLVTHDDECDQFNNQNPPIDLSRYINEEDDDDDVNEKPDLNECVYSEDKACHAPKIAADPKLKDHHQQTSQRKDQCFEHR